MSDIKPETEVKRAFARASRRMCQTLKPLPSRRRQPARTIWTVSRLLEAWRDPREVLLEVASMDTDKLAELAGCTLLEALQERRLCAQAVLPYVAQKLPVQVNMQHSRAIHLNIVSDEEYRELVDVAAGPGEKASSFDVQVVEHLGTEATADTTMARETGVSPPVADAFSGGDEPKRQHNG